MSFANNTVSAAPSVVLLILISVYSIPFDSKISVSSLLYSGSSKSLVIKINLPFTLKLSIECSINVLPLTTINTPIVQGTWTSVNTSIAGTVQTTFTPINVNGSCVSDTTITVEIHPLPVASFTASPEVFYNSNPIFCNYSLNSLSYF
jgi:hypothetical protein